MHRSISSYGACRSSIANGINALCRPSVASIMRPLSVTQTSVTHNSRQPQRRGLASGSGHLSATEAKALYAIGEQRITPAVTRLAPVVIRSGSGSWITTVDGQRLLDFTSGIGVVSTGHCHPHVVAAVQKQVATLVHGQVNIAMHEPMVRLTEKLAPLMPTSKTTTSAPLDTFFFWNSGAEAVEAAIKLARHATGKQNIIVMQGGFHGRTFGTMALTTSKTVYRAGFGPLPSGIHVAPFPYSSQLPKCTHASEKARSDYCIESIELMLKQQTAPSETAAIILEPILGEGGYVVPPDGFLHALRTLCDRHKILLICDEVQSGCGRTGKMWAVQHWDIVPDILIMAKGIASGYPLSAIAANRALMAKQPGGSMGGTYSGNAVACTAAIATLEVFEKEKVLQNTVLRGAQLTRRLNDIARDHRLTKGPSGGILEVRGLGLMQAIQFSSKAPYGFASRVSAICRERDLLLLTTSVFETIRFIPPLTVTELEVDQAMDILHAAIIRADAELPKAK